MGKMEVKDVLVGFGLVLEAAKDLAVKIVEVFNDVIGDLEAFSVFRACIRSDSSYPRLGARKEPSLFVMNVFLISMETENADSLRK